VGKIPMLYDNLVDSAIVFSGNTANILEFLLKTLAKAYELLLSQEA
jgi:hypothetical protein